MKNNEQTVRFDLTPEQKEQVKKATNKDVEAVELTVNELEERIAPRAILFRQQSPRRGDHATTGGRGESLRPPVPCAPLPSRAWHHTLAPRARAGIQ
jgi:hypothetical protein